MPLKYSLLALGGSFLALLAFASRLVSAAADSQSREADRVSITKILNAQQSAWNAGDVDAFLKGYWHSPELTFSGSSGVARGWEGRSFGEANILGVPFAPALFSAPGTKRKL
jgi:hypothetical protein